MTRERSSCRNCGHKIVRYETDLEWWHVSTGEDLCRPWQRENEAPTVYSAVACNEIHDGSTGFCTLPYGHAGSHNNPAPRVIRYGPEQ